MWFGAHWKSIDCESSISMFFKPQVMNRTTKKHTTTNIIHAHTDTQTHTLYPIRNKIEFTIFKISNAIVVSINVLHSPSNSIFLNKSHHIKNMPIVAESINECAEFLCGYISHRYALRPFRLNFFPPATPFSRAFSISRNFWPSEWFPTPLIHIPWYTPQIYNTIHNQHQISHPHTPEISNL